MRRTGADGSIEYADARLSHARVARLCSRSDTRCESRSSFPGLLSLPADALAREPSLSRIAVARGRRRRAGRPRRRAARATLGARRRVGAARGAAVRGSTSRDRWVVARRSGDDRRRARRRTCSPAASTISTTRSARRCWSTAESRTSRPTVSRLPRRAATRGSPSATRARAGRDAFRSSAQRADRCAQLLPPAPTRRDWRRWLTEMQMLLHEHPVNRGAKRWPRTGQRRCGFREAARCRDAARAPPIVARGDALARRRCRCAASHALRGSRRDATPATLVDGARAVRQATSRWSSLEPVDDVNATLARRPADSSTPRSRRARARRDFITESDRRRRAGRRSWNAQRAVATRRRARRAWRAHLVRIAP